MELGSVTLKINIQHTPNLGAEFHFRLVDDHRQLKTSVSTFSRGRYTTVRLRALHIAFPPFFPESSIKTVLNQSAKNRDFFRQRNQTPRQRVRYRSWGSLKMNMGRIEFQYNGAELTLLFVPARNTARARQKGWGP